jgi:hypothetical protein
LSERVGWAGAVQKGRREEIGGGLG